MIRNRVQLHNVQHKKSRKTLGQKSRNVINESLKQHFITQSFSLMSITDGVTDVTRLTYDKGLTFKEIKKDLRLTIFYTRKSKILNLLKVLKTHTVV